MKTWYNIEVQMLAQCERNYELDQQIGSALGFSEEDIDEREPHKLTVTIDSDVEPITMEHNIWRLLADNYGVYYIDVLYRSEVEELPQRFTVWDSGRIQHYRTHVIYEEVEENE